MESSSVQIDDIQVYDEAVTGHKSSVWAYGNYLNEEISVNGTKLTPTNSSPYFYIADSLISGDFEVTYDFVSGQSYTHMTLKDTSKNDVLNFIFNANNSNEWLFGLSGQYSYASYSVSAPFSITIKRVGTTYTYYVNDHLLGTVTYASLSDCYFSFRGDNGTTRYTQFKDFKIKSL